MARRAPPAIAAPTHDWGFAVRVFDRGLGGVAVSVDAELERFGLPGLTLSSSDRRAPLITGERWPVGIRWAIDDRLRNEGARKGRVLSIWQGGQVVAACAWHLHEDGPLVILDLGRRDDLGERVGSIGEAALMLCLRQVAGTPPLHRDTTTLRWADPGLDRIDDVAERAQVRTALRARAVALAFTPLRPRPKWRAGKWIVERQFPR